MGLGWGVMGDSVGLKWVDEGFLWGWVGVMWVSMGLGWVDEGFLWGWVGMMGV